MFNHSLTIPALGGCSVPLPEYLAVACLVSDHVVVEFHGRARLTPAVSDDRSHAFRGVGRLLPVMAMQRVDEPVMGFDDGVILVSIRDQAIWLRTCTQNNYFDQCVVS